MAGNKNVYCKICNKETKYKNTTTGYRITCGAKCSGVYNRKNLKENKEKFIEFTNKVSNNMKKELKKREQLGIKDDIIRKAITTNKFNIKSMSKQDKIERFGWMNKLSKEEKYNFINKVSKKTGFF